MMGILMSPVREIDDLRLVDFKKNKVYTVKAIRVDDTIMFQHDDGFSAAKCLGAGKWAFPISFTSWAWQKSFLPHIYTLLHKDSTQAGNLVMSSACGRKSGSYLTLLNRDGLYGLSLMEPALLRSVPFRHGR